MDGRFVLPRKTFRRARQPTMSIRPPGSRWNDPAGAEGGSSDDNRAIRKMDYLTGKPGNGHLLDVLELSDGAHGLRECGGQMAQGHGVGTAVGFARWIGKQPQARTDMAGEITPSDDPATGGAQREEQARGPPCGVGGSFSRNPFKQHQKLAGPQRAVGNDVMPIDRECASAA